MVEIEFLNFDKDGDLKTGDQAVPPEVTDVVLVVHGWHEDQESASHHYEALLAPLAKLLAANPDGASRRKVAYFGVIWPSDKYSDDLTILGMRPDVGGPPPSMLASGGSTMGLSDADLASRARNVADFLGISSEQLAAQALDASKNQTARNDLVQALQDAAKRISR